MQSSMGVEVRLSNLHKTRYVVSMGCWRVVGKSMRLILCYLYILCFLYCAWEYVYMRHLRRLGSFGFVIYIPQYSHIQLA